MERLRRSRSNEIKNFTPLGAMLREARVSKDRSVRAVAISAGISPAYLSALEHGINPKTNKPSTPSPEIRNRLFSILGITTGIANDTIPDMLGEASQIPNLSSLSVREVGIMSAYEREKAANMVRDGRFNIDGPNNEFNYYVELANLYGSAAVAMQVVVGQLDKEVQELKDKYRIGEIDTDWQGLQPNILNTQDDTLMPKVQSTDTSFESEPEGSSLRVEDPRV